MSEIRRKFFDVLSEEQISNLHNRCSYDKDDYEMYFTPHDFINGYALIEYGECDPEFGAHNSNIIDTKGKFVEIILNDDIKYVDGKIVKLKDADRGSYHFEVHRILELDYKHSFKGYVIKSTSDTAFFFIKVTRFSFRRGEETLDIHFVINNNLEVIASFSDKNTWGNEYDGYKNCLHREGFLFY